MHKSFRPCHSGDDVGSYQGLCSGCSFNAAHQSSSLITNFFLVDIHLYYFAYASIRFCYHAASSQSKKNNALVSGQQKLIG
mmetsp:Transcript_101080/g.198353  ORF Transcript_101080/g.198353 Transcript_101080/m.198353 type:complete len:81 (+) Transcript_101080:230-472(+)